MENWYIFMIVFGSKNRCIFNVPHRIQKWGGGVGSRGWDDVGASEHGSQQFVSPPSMNASPHIGRWSTSPPFKSGLLW